MREEMKCFGCGKDGHKKWECLNRRKRKQEEAAPPCKVWEKVKKHSGAKGLPVMTRPVVTTVLSHSTL